MGFEWLLLLLLVCCSGFISASETALFGLSRRQLRDFALSHRPLRVRTAHLMQRPRRVLTTLLMANTAINVLFFAVSFVLFNRMSAHNALVASLGGVVSLFAVIICGEVVPKAVAMAHAHRFAPVAAPVITALQACFAPARWFLQGLIIEPLARLLTEPHAGAQDVSVEELRALVESSAHQNLIGSAENRMLQGILALPHTNVRALMTPRVDVVAVPVDAAPADALRVMKERRLTKVPAYGRNLDDVRGWVYSRDLFIEPRAPLARLCRPMQFVPEQVDLLRLIEIFRETQSNIAVVVDEYGGMAGVISLEDVFEQIVGELPSTSPAEPPAAEAIDENTYRLAGDLSIIDWLNRFKLTANAHPRAARVQTIGGLMLAELGRVPDVGDSIRLRNLQLTVEKLSGRRIESILLTRLSDGADSVGQADKGASDERSDA